VCSRLPALVLRKSRPAFVITYRRTSWYRVLAPIRSLSRSLLLSRPSCLAVKSQRVRTDFPLLLLYLLLLLLLSPTHPPPLPPPPLVIFLDCAVVAIEGGSCVPLPLVFSRLGWFAGVFAVASLEIFPSNRLPPKIQSFCSGTVSPFDSRRNKHLRPPISLTAYCSLTGHGCPH